MSIILEKQKAITLQTECTVSLDPDTLDCCGVDRPIDCNPCSTLTNIRARRDYVVATADDMLKLYSGHNAIDVSEDKKTS